MVLRAGNVFVGVFALLLRQRLLANCEGLAKAVGRFALPIIVRLALRVVFTVDVLAIQGGYGVLVLRRGRGRRVGLAIIQTAYAPTAFSH